MNGESRTSDRVVCVIPARYESTRFPGKPLVSIGGRPMVAWVVQRALDTPEIDEVIVATDHEGIFEAASSAGARAVMTRPDHPSGTDRVAEAIQGVDADLIVNLQGDEPLMPPAVIGRLVRLMQPSGVGMGTVAVRFHPGIGDPSDPNLVKVVVAEDGRALYFSRACIPYHREGGEPVVPLWHWGLYAYRRDLLEQFVRWPPSPLERCEKLEQLRALEHGVRIQVAVIEEPLRGAGVDTPGDVPVVERLLAERGEL